MSTTIKPTEEQEQASRAVFYGFPDEHLDMLLEHGAPRVARLLAEREAKLRRALASVCVDILTSTAVTDTLWCHDSGLATTNDYIAGVLGINTVDAYGNPTAELARLAHYDDAKADAHVVAVVTTSTPAPAWCVSPKPASTEGGEG